IYKDGEVILETDVVSGLNDKEHKTPAGAFFAYDKKTDTVLRGDKQDDGEWGYETPVDYWIRLTDTGIGLHDANWRYSFGGNIWKWNGSHGCVNIPPKVMPTVYELVDENMPVVVHYGDTQ
ncbi:MAG: L,D-transpeptidase, partial [Firmicutes bacterium]|nr:L,D-transpeptidase [Bacillota bacterium]